jgi:hypothetical protein
MLSDAPAYARLLARIEEAVAAANDAVDGAGRP